MRLHGSDIYAEGVDAASIRLKVGMVFQKPNPFPKTIYENITWGAKINGIKANWDELVETSLRRAALWDDVKDKLKQSGLALSGGQQQRVALARTIAIEPKVLLLDEPLSNLDARMRLSVRRELRALQQRLGITFIFVTHDQEEANTICDRIAVMEAGVIQQIGTPMELYERPANLFVANFLGTANIFEGRVERVRDGCPHPPAHAMLRADRSAQPQRNRLDLGGDRPRSPGETLRIIRAAMDGEMDIAVAEMTEAQRLAPGQQPCGRSFRLDQKGRNLPQRHRDIDTDRGLARSLAHHHRLADPPKLAPLRLADASRS